MSEFVEEKERRKEEEVMKLKDKVKELRNQMADRSEVETATEQYNELQVQIQEKEDEVEGLTEAMNKMKLDHEKQMEETLERINKYEADIAEKDEVITGHADNLEHMKSTILTLKDSLQSSGIKLEDKARELEEAQSQLEKAQSQLKELQENQEPEGDIEKEKLAVLNTINSHLTASGKTSQIEESLEIQELSCSDVFKIVVEKIQQKIEVSQDDQLLEEQENVVKELKYDIKDLNEKLERKKKDLTMMTKHKENLRSQLDSAVKLVNNKDFEPQSRKTPEVGILPSLQSQLQILKDESENTEVTRDTTEQIVENFERNDRLLRSKLEKAITKIKTYKSRISDYKRTSSF